MARSFKEFIETAKRKHGDLFDPTDLNPDFIPHFESGERIEVDFGYKGKDKARGIVGVTTGWRPCFLLLPRRDSRASSTLLLRGDKFVRVIPKRK